jgi:hypothetical protein
LFGGFVLMRRLEDALHGVEDLEQYMNHDMISA